MTSIFTPDGAAIALEAEAAAEGMDVADYVAAAKKAAKAAAIALAAAIAACESIYSTYKSLNCENCQKCDKAPVLETKIACLEKLVSGRASYLSRGCDNILARSIARGSQVAIDGHTTQLVQDQKRLQDCYDFLAAAS